MTEHLPECMQPQTEFPCKQCWEIECECTCICKRLRACEDRVIAAAVQRVEAVLRAKAIDVYYGRGLADPPQFIWLNNALSAIDELREEKEGA